MEKKYNGLVGRQLYPLINGSVRELNDSCTVYAKVIFFFKAVHLQFTHQWAEYGAESCRFACGS